jgi:hypothetical protein
MTIPLSPKRISGAAKPSFLFIFFDRIHFWHEVSASAFRITQPRNLFLGESHELLIRSSVFVILQIRGVWIPGYGPLQLTGCRSSDLPWDTAPKRAGAQPCSQIETKRLRVKISCCLPQLHFYGRVMEKVAVCCVGSKDTLPVNRFAWSQIV